MATKIIDAGTVKQLELMFGDIADSADALEHVINECVMEPGVSEIVAKLLFVAETLTQRIGLLADAGGEKIDSIFVKRGGTEAWIMPPAYHSAHADVEVSHV